MDIQAKQLSAEEKATFIKKYMVSIKQHSNLNGPALVDLRSAPRMDMIIIDPTNKYAAKTFKPANIKYNQFKFKAYMDNTLRGTGLGVAYMFKPALGVILTGLTLAWEIAKSSVVEILVDDAMVIWAMYLLHEDHADVSEADIFMRIQSEPKLHNVTELDVTEALDRLIKLKCIKKSVNKRYIIIEKVIFKK
jgi:hypothetical protein